jgi:hypothetical protein
MRRVRRVAEWGGRSAPKASVPEEGRVGQGPIHHSTGGCVDVLALPLPTSSASHAILTQKR